jgi:serine/threonine-protein phosphatase 6 regulatory subunit 3
MACEVICCDISEIIDTLVEANDGALIDQLFSLLKLDAPLDARLAGYFEKVVALLLQRKTLQMITYINKGGTDLFALFVKHIDSFSILELVRRILQPVFSDGMDDGGMYGMEQEDEIVFPTVVWHKEQAVITLLLESLDPKGDSDVHKHAAEVLIHILITAKQANEESSLLHAFETADNALSLVSLSLPNGDVSDVSSSSLIGALYVLETLLSCNHISDLTNMEGEEKETEANGADGETPEVFKALLGRIPMIARYLEGGDEPVMKSQYKTEGKSLGMRRLKLVELVVILIQTRQDEVDAELISARVLPLCVGLFFEFEWSNMLHSLVEAIIINVVESGSTELQSSLLTDGKLLEGILKAYKQDEAGRAEPRSCRTGYIGHLNRLCNLFVATLDSIEVVEGEELPAALANEPSSRFAKLLMEDALFSDFQTFVLGTLAEINVVETCPLGGQGAPSNEQHLDDLFDLGPTMHELGGNDLEDEDDEEPRNDDGDDSSDEEELDFDPRDGNEENEGADDAGKQGG